MSHPLLPSQPGGGRAPEPVPGPGWPLLLGFAGAVVLAHLVVVAVTPYGFHRDEFLYMAMGRHLRLFAMDSPPLIALLSEAQRALLGDSLLALRISPALAHGLLVGLTGWIAWALGGSRFAQALAMLPVASAPLFLRAGSLFQPVVFDQLCWTAVLAALCALAAMHTPERRTAAWIALGAAAGVGLLTKFAIAFLGLGVLGALLLARRGWLATRGPWIAVALALLIGSPSLVGQIALDFPFLTQATDLRAAQLDRIDYGDWWLELVLMHGPPAFLLAAASAGALLAHRRFTPWRVVGWSCVLAFTIVLLLRGKAYYTGPVFPTLYAAGAVLTADALARLPGRARIACGAAIVLIVTGFGLLALPLALPVLPPAATARFAVRLGVTQATVTNRGVRLELPQDYADMLGWERKVERVAEVWRTLPPDERRHAVIVASNYGQAGAIDFYGPRHGLPAAVAPVGSYWFWGPGEKPGAVVLKVGGEREDLVEYCGSTELATRIDEPWVVPEERDLAVWICRQPRTTLQQIWPRFEGVN